MERETRLREEEEIERGGGGRGGGKRSGTKPKEDRRASMVEVLRRIRRGDRGQTAAGVGANGLHQAAGLNDENRNQEEVGGGGGGGGGGDGDDGDGDDGDELFIQQERLEALALALKQRGHALPARPATAAATPAVDADVGGTACASKGNTPSSDTPRSKDRGRRDGGGGGSAGQTGQGKNVRAGEAEAATTVATTVATARHQEQRLELQRGHEELGDGDGDDDGEGMLDLLTPEERERFLREVASGRLGKLIVPWVPWWKQTARVQEVTAMTAGGRTSHSLPPPVAGSGHGTMCSFGGPEDGVSSPPTRPSTPEQQQQQQQQQQHLSAGSDGGSSSRRGSTSSSSSRNSSTSTGSSSSSSSSSGGAKQTPSVAVGENACTRHSFAALLCQPFYGAPDFSTICAKRPSPTLPALAADLVYAYALAARLYNGCWCSDPVGASLALVGASPVLRDGATPCTVGRALTACVERAVEGEGGASYRGYAESLREVRI